MAAVQPVNAASTGTEVVVTGNQLISIVKEVHYVVFQNGATVADAEKLLEKLKTKQ